MWIVRLALQRPYTFVVASLLLLLMTPFVLLRTPTDIFPSINIPVVSVVWQYTGLSAKDIEQRMVFSHERALTTTVNNIDHIESTSYDGVGVIKVFFQPGTSPDAGVAQVTAVSQTILRQLPPGTTPPLVIDIVDHFNLLGQGKTPDVNIYLRGKFTFPAYEPFDNPVVRGPDIFCDPI